MKILKSIEAGPIIGGIAIFDHPGTQSLCRGRMITLIYLSRPLNGGITITKNEVTGVCGVSPSVFEEKIEKFVAQEDVEPLIARLQPIFETLIEDDFDFFAKNAKNG